MPLQDLCGIHGRICHAVRSVALVAAVVVMFPALAEAKLTAEQRLARELQHRHLARVVDRQAMEGSEKDALLGMLILRDEEPEKTAMCARATRGHSHAAFEEHLLSCPRCREIAEIARGGLPLRRCAHREPSVRAQHLYRGAERLVDDGFGYIPTREKLGNKLDRAQDLLGQALLDSPEFPEALQLFGTLKEIAGDTAAAEKAFKKALNLCVDVPSGLENAAIFQMRHKLYGHAHSLLRFAMHHRANYRAARLLAWLYFEAKNPGEAANMTIDEAIRLMEWVVREETSPTKREQDRALLRFLRDERLRSVDSGENNASASSASSICQLARRWAVEGGSPSPKGLKKSVASWMPDAAACRIVARARQALFDSEGFVTEADQQVAYPRIAAELSSVVERSRDHSAEAHHLLAILAFREGDRDRALRHAARAVELQPTSSRYMSNCAYFLQSKGQWRDARTFYLEARRQNPDNTATHIGLLSLAIHLPEISIREIVELVRDWSARERAPELRDTAKSLRLVLTDLRRELDGPAPAELSPGADAPEMSMIRELLRGFLGPPTSDSANANRGPFTVPSHPKMKFTTGSE